MDCKRVTVIRIGPVISTKKALYFVGSMVLFFLYRRRKRRELPTKGKATAFVDHRMSQPLACLQSTTCSA